MSSETGGKGLGQAGSLLLPAPSIKERKSQLPPHLFLLQIKSIFGQKYALCFATCLPGAGTQPPLWVAAAVAQCIPGASQSWAGGSGLGSTSAPGA